MSKTTLVGPIKTRIEAEETCRALGVKITRCTGYA